MKQLVLILFFFSVFGSACLADWQWIGPEAGNIKQLIPDRNHPGLWYAVNDGNLYRSMNNGESWRRLSLSGLVGARGPGYFDDRFPPVSVHPRTSEVFVASPDGVWVSSDLGKTFSLRAKPSSQMFKVFPNPRNPKILYGFNDDDLLISRNSGKTWKPVNNLPYDDIPDEYRCYFEGLDVLFSPFDAATIYSSGLKSCSHFGDNWVNPFFFASYDSGKTWQNLERKAYGFAGDPLSPDEVYAYQTNDLEYNRASTIKRLTPAGWLDASSTLHNLRSLAPLPQSPGSVLALASDEGDYSYQPRSNLYLSGNSGTTWTKLQTYPMLGKLRLLGVLDQPDVQLLAGTDGGGVYRGGLEGAWVESNPGFHEYWPQQLSQSLDGSLYALQFEYLNNFLYRYDSADRSWRNLSFQMPDQTNMILADPNKPEHLVSLGADVYVSRDYGLSWQVPGLDTYESFFSGCFDPIHSSRVYVGGRYNVYKSTNGGNTFEPIHAEFAWNIVADPNVSGVVYVAGYRLMRSVDGGKTFSRADNGIDEGVGDLFPLGAPGDYVAVTFDGGIYRTGNGRTWQNVGRLPWTNFADNIVSADSNGQHLYVIDDSRILYESIDGGATWEDISTQFGSGTIVFDMTNPQQPPFRVATNHGVFELTP